MLSVAALIYIACPVYLPVDLSSALKPYIRYTAGNTEADTLQFMFVKLIVVGLLKTFTYFSYIHRV